MNTSKSYRFVCFVLIVLALAGAMLACSLPGGGNCDGNLVHCVNGGDSTYEHVSTHPVLPCGNPLADPSNCQ